MNVQPARSGSKHLAAPRKEFPSPQRTPGSEAGVCPPPAAKRREPPFDGCVPSNECSASSQWPEALAAPRKEISSPQRTPGSEAGVCPPPAAKRRELQWNSSSAVPSKFSQPGVARNTSLRREKNSLHRSAPRGAKPVFARLRRPNGVNFNGTAHLLFHQSSASPEWLETPRCAAKRIPFTAAHPGERSRCLPASGGQTA